MGSYSPNVSHDRSVATHHPSMYINKAQQIAELLDQKGEDYNSPDNFFVQLANAWSGLFGIELTPSQCCAMMIVFKSCRIINNPGHKDTADDLVGYSLIMTELVKIQEQDG